MTPREHAEITIKLLEERKKKKIDKGKNEALSFTIESSIRSNARVNRTKGKGWRKSGY